MLDDTTLDQTELRRIARQLSLPGFGIRHQERLAGAHVLVIGAGGLGCPAMQSLAAVGVGHISVIDDDTVDLTNIHRQILFGVQDQGRPKVEVAAERLSQLQPGITVSPLQYRLTTDNVVSILEDVDLVVDGSDTFATKYLVADAAEITGTPLVWGTVLRYRGDIALWWSGSGSPADSPGLRDLFPVQPKADSVPDCATAGVLGVTTSVVAGLMATEAVKFLTGIGDSIPGKVFSYDALCTQLRSFTVIRDPGRKLAESLADNYGGTDCAVPRDHPAEFALIQSGQAMALDVREHHEKLLMDLPVSAPGLHLPVSESTEASVREVFAAAARITDTLVVYCASGQRSGEFVTTWQALAQDFKVQLQGLPGGVNRLT